MDCPTRTRRTEKSRVPLGFFLCIAPILLLSGCSSVPSIYVAGSYFPAWLLSVLIAIVLTVLIRVGLIYAGVDDVLPLRLLVYVCIALALTFAMLLLFFA